MFKLEMSGVDTRQRHGTFTIGGKAPRTALTRVSPVAMHLAAERRKRSCGRNIRRHRTHRSIKPTQTTNSFSLAKQKGCLSRNLPTLTAKLVERPDA